jgi:hypothetical protein
MIDALRDLAGKVGPDISVRQFTTECGYSRPMVYEYFRNWADLRAQAGLPSQADHHGRNALYTRESLIAALQQLAARLGEDLSQIQFTHHTGISDCPVYRVFGNWKNFRAAAGLAAEPKPGVKPQYTREDLLNLLRRQVTLQGRHIVLDQFCAATGVTRDMINRCGGWTGLRQELGLPPRGRRLRQPSLKTRLSNLADVETMHSDGDALLQDLLEAQNLFDDDHLAAADRLRRPLEDLLYDLDNESDWLPPVQLPPWPQPPRPR